MSWLDIKLINGDWAIGEDGDFVTDDGFSTTLALAFHADARADSSEVLIAQNRGGWLGNVESDIDDNFGSKLWLFRQSRMNQKLLNDVSNESNLAVKFMIDEFLLKFVDTDTTVKTLGSINTIVNLYRFNSPSESLQYTTWENTK